MVSTSPTEDHSPSPTHLNALLLSLRETYILIHLVETKLQAWRLHPPLLLSVLPPMKHESLQEETHPFLSAEAGHLISIISPDRSIRSQSTNHFLQKLETLPPRRPKALAPVKGGRVGTAVMTTTRKVEIQTKEAVRQITVAALRLRGVEDDVEYGGLVNMTVQAGMFALRGKVKTAKTVGMGEIGDVVDSLLKLFLDRE